jgi:hypothetical protein
MRVLSGVHRLLCVCERDTNGLYLLLLYANACLWSDRPQGEGLHEFGALNTLLFVRCVTRVPMYTDQSPSMGRL